MSCTITIPSLLHQVCGDSTRYALSGVLVDAKNGLAAACDGRCFAVTTIDVQQDEDHATDLPPVVVPSQLLRAGGKRPRVVQLSERGATRADVDGQVDAVTAFVDGSYPTLAKCVTPPTKTVRVMLDVELLYRLAQALHHTDEDLGVELDIPIQFRDMADGTLCEPQVSVSMTNAPIAVAPINSPLRAAGLIQPMSFDHAFSAYQRVTELVEAIDTQVAVTPVA